MDGVEENQMTRTGPALRRWGRAVAAVVGTGIAVTLTACATAAPEFSPKPVETITPSPGTRTPSGSASATATPSASTTASPTTEGVKGSGSLAMFATVTKALAGTCTTKDGTPTITLADHRNDFYGTVDVTLVLKPGKTAVGGVDAAFGEDSEGFAWKLSYDAAKPAAGTSAKLAVAGSTYTVSGKLRALETRKGKTIDEVLPFKLVAKCSGAEW